MYQNQSVILIKCYRISKNNTTNELPIDNTDSCESLIRKRSLVFFVEWIVIVQHNIIVIMRTFHDLKMGCKNYQLANINQLFYKKKVQLYQCS